MFRPVSALLTSAALALSFFVGSVAASEAGWHIVADQSNISFVSVKNGSIGEAHHFTAMAGMVDSHGAVTISVPLASVETNIDIRNERMGNFLFETAKYAEVTIKTQLDLKAYEAMDVGARTRISVEAQLDLHGVASEVDMDVFISRLSATEVIVNSAQPVLIDADEFDLGTGIEKLKEIAGLDSIGVIVPVTFSLLFTRLDKG
ncbi:MAG: YceI family protein [Kordiimonadaceae bacterium]|nr:YceI family protein [Kordiimonadaceae bacterium]